MYYLLVLLFVTFATYGSSAYLLTNVPYEQTNALYRLDADFSQRPVSFSVTAPHAIMRGGANSGLRLGNVFYQTMWTTFGASNQSLAYFTEDPLTRLFRPVALIGSNDRACCKKNLRVLHKHHLLLLRNSSRIDYFELDPLTNLPLHQDLKGGSIQEVYSFDTLQARDEEFVVSISLNKDAIRVHHFDGQTFNLETSSIFPNGELKQIHALKDSFFLIQENWKLSLARFNLKTNQIILLKSIPFSDDFEIKFTPKRDNFLVFSEALYAGIRLFDQGLNLIASFTEGETDTFTRVISFFDDQHFVMPIYHYRKDEFNLHFFKLDPKEGKIERIHQAPQPFFAESFRDLFEVR